MNTQKTIGPVFISQPDNLASVAVHLAFRIKNIPDNQGTWPVPNQLTALITEGVGPMVFYDGVYYLGLVSILDLLEDLRPEPSLFPNGNRGMPIALKYWAEQFLCDGQQADRPEEKINKHISLISRQMLDGRDFLQGKEPGLADILSFSPLFLLSQDKNAQALSGLPKFPNLQSWFLRMKGLYHSKPSEADDLKALKLNFDNQGRACQYPMGPSLTLKGKAVFEKESQLYLALEGSGDDPVIVSFSTLDFVR